MQGLSNKGRPQEEYHGYMQGRKNMRGKELDSGRRRGSGGVLTLARRPKGAYEDSSSAGRPCTQSQPQIRGAAKELEGSQQSDNKGLMSRQRLNSGFDAHAFNDVEPAGGGRPATTTWAGGAACFNYRSNGSINSIGN